MPNNKYQINLKSQISNLKSGFTLIELLIVILITATIASISLANYKQGEKNKRVSLAADGIVATLTLAQSYTRAGKNTNNTDANCRIPEYYYVDFFYSTNAYTLFALNNCGSSDLIELFPLPNNTRIQPLALILDSIIASNSLRIAFYPPFAKAKAKVDLEVLDLFNSATITVESVDGSYSKTVTVDGLAGRIE